MSRVEIVDDRGVKGILLDGYFKEFPFYKDIDWEKAIEEDRIRPYRDKSAWLTGYEKYLKEEKMTPAQSTQSNFHRKLAANLRYRFCIYDNAQCTQFIYPARGVKPIERMISFKRKKVREAVLPIFSREIEKDLAEGKANYAFNLIFLNLIHGNHCPVFEECRYNWMEFTGFSDKSEKDYVDFDSYKEAADLLLYRNIKFGAKED